MSGWWAQRTEGHFNPCAKDTDGRTALVVFDGRAVETQWRPNRTRRRAEGDKVKDAGATLASRPDWRMGLRREREGGHEHVWVYPRTVPRQAGNSRVQKGSKVKTK
jgi:hypothetical protein